MKKFYIIIFLLLSVHFSFSQVSDSEFEKMLSNAVQNQHVSAQEISDFERYKPVLSVKNTGNSTWELIVQHWVPNTTSDYYVGLQKGRAIVKNNGDHFEFYGMSQAIISILVDDVAEGKWVKKGEGWAHKNVEVSELSFGKGDNFLTVEGKGYYDKGLSKITNDLNLMIRMSRGRLHAIAFDEKKIREKALSEFQKNSITEMPKGWLPFLVEDNTLFDFEYDKKETPNGYWSFNDNSLNIKFYLYNYEDKLIYYAARIIDKSTGESKKDELLSQMNKLVSKSTIKGASKTEAILNNNTFYGVKATFNYDGTLKGKDIYDGYWDMWTSYKKKLAKTLNAAL